MSTAFLSEIYSPVPYPGQWPIIDLIVLFVIACFALLFICSGKRMVTTCRDNYRNELISQLRRLQGKETMTEKEKYFDMSRILSVYLEREYSVPALCKSSDELIDDLQSSDIEVDMKEKWIHILKQCEEKKFSLFSEFHSYINKDINIVINILDNKNSIDCTSDL